MTTPNRVLLVANRTAAGKALLDAVELRAENGAATTFHLIVPATPMGLHRVVDPEVSGRDEAAEQLSHTLPLLEARAGGPVSGDIGDADPFAAIQDALARGRFDEIVISTLPRRVSRWLRLDLVSRVRGLGLPVTHVESRNREPAQPAELVERVAIAA